MKCLNCILVSCRSYSLLLTTRVDELLSCLLLLLWSQAHKILTKEWMLIRHKWGGGRGGKNLCITLQLMRHERAPPPPPSECAHLLCSFSFVRCTRFSYIILLLYSYLCPTTYWAALVGKRTCWLWMEDRAGRKEEVNNLVFIFVANVPTDGSSTLPPPVRYAAARFHSMPPLLHC